MFLDIGVWYVLAVFGVVNFTKPNVSPFLLLTVYQKQSGSNETKTKHRKTSQEP